MIIKLNKHTFSGTSNIFNGFLASVLISLSHTVAAQAVQSVSDLTDSSGGVVGAGLVIPTALPAFTAGTTDAVAKAEFEASLTSIRKNVRALIRQVNAIVDVVPVFAALQENIGGAAPGAALEATDVSMTGTSTGGALVAVSGANAAVTALRDRMAQLVPFVDQLATAFGVAKLPSALASVPVSATFAAVSVDTGTATTGANTVAKSAADAVLASLAANISTIAAKLAEIQNVTPKVEVIAG